MSTCILPCELPQSVSQTLQYTPQIDCQLFAVLAAICPMAKIPQYLSYSPVRRWIQELEAGMQGEVFGSLSWTSVLTTAA